MSRWILVASKAYTVKQQEVSVRTSISRCEYNESHFEWQKIMFIGFNLRLDKNADIFCEEYEELQKFGRKHLENQKTSYKKSLREYVKQNEIDGTKIQNEWFPEINADIFISHSHKDEALACALAGWINRTFGLNCFIDSNVWGIQLNY